MSLLPFRIPRPGALQCSGLVLLQRTRKVDVLVVRGLWIALSQPSADPPRDQTRVRRLLHPPPRRGSAICRQDKGARGERAVVSIFSERLAAALAPAVMATLVIATAA